METMRERFQSFENALFEHMSWMDPKVWEDERTYGNKYLEYLVNHFKATLEKARFQRLFCRNWFQNGSACKISFWKQLIGDETNARKIWNHNLLYCKKKFSKVYPLIQICFSITSSNDATEHAFNILTLLF